MTALSKGRRRSVVVGCLKRMSVKVQWQQTVNCSYQRWRRVEILLVLCLLPWNSHSPRTGILLLLLVTGCVWHGWYLWAELEGGWIAIHVLPLHQHHRIAPGWRSSGWERKNRCSPLHFCRSCPGVSLLKWGTVSPSIRRSTPSSRYYVLNYCKDSIRGCAGNGKRLGIVSWTKMGWELNKEWLETLMRIHWKD